MVPRLRDSRVLAFSGRGGAFHATQGPFFSRSLYLQNFRTSLLETWSGKEREGEKNDATSVFVIQHLHLYCSCPPPSVSLSLSGHLFSGKLEPWSICARHLNAFLVHPFHRKWRSRCDFTQLRQHSTLNRICCSVVNGHEQSRHIS